MEFTSQDRLIAVELRPTAIKAIVERCAAAFPSETGGVLIGHHSRLRDRAIIVEALGPTPDSRGTRFSFFRGWRGLQRLIDQAWGRGDFYLGEWHFHPATSSSPSDQDRDQIAAFSRDPAYACPDPVLLVVGGGPRTVFVSASVVRARTCERLSPDERDVRN
jgi:integrative and conjugative element protein (TIGR02256 family)